MRLGGGNELFEAQTADELDGLLEKLDTYGLSTVTGPWGYDVRNDDELIAFGERAAKLGLMIGESHSRQNLLFRDPDVKAERIGQLKEGLRKAELMGSHSVCILVGTAGVEDHLAAHNAFNYSDEARKEYRETMLRILDGLAPGNTLLLIEPWPNTFFWQPEAVREFLDSVGHPRLGVHLDLMNMVDPYHYYRTTEFIDRTFDLLGNYIGAIHFKDLYWDWEYMYMKFDEVPIGDGVIDYKTYIRRIAELGRDIPCFVEHFPTEGDFAKSFARLHRIASEIGTEFLPRAV